MAIQNQLRDPTTGRMGGTLFESASGFMQGLKKPKVEKGPAGPTSPAGVMAAGGTQDQAKMFGAGAQGKASLDRAMSTVTAAPTAAQPGAAQQAAAAQSAALQGLGMLGGRVQQLIEGRTAKVTEAAAGASINEEALAKLYDKAPTADARATAIAAAKASLEAYLANPSQATLAAFIETAGLGPEALTDGGAAPYLLAPEEKLKTLVEGADLEAAVTLDQLNLAEAGINAQDAAAALGVTPEAFAKLTLPELQKAVEATQARTFSQVASLEAEQVNASDIRKAEIDRELQALRGTGAAEVERQFTNLAQDIEKAQTINWQGRPITLKELLEDDQITQTILGALSNEAELKLLKDNPGTAQLATWITNNKGALKQVATDLEATAGELVGVSNLQTPVAGTYGKEGLAALLALGGKNYGTVMTAAELQDAQAFLSSNPIAQAIADNSAAGLAIKANPKLITEISELLPAGATADTVNELFSAREKTLADPGLAALVGVEGEPAYLTPAQVAELNRIEGSPAWKDSTLQAWIKLDPERRKMWAGMNDAQIAGARKAAADFQSNPGLGALVGFATGDPLAGPGQAMLAAQLKRNFPELVKAAAQIRTAGMSPKELQALSEMGGAIAKRRLEGDDATSLISAFTRIRTDSGVKLALGLIGPDADASQLLKPTKANVKLIKNRLKAWDKIPRDVQSDQEFRKLLEAGVIKGAKDLGLFKKKDVWDRVKGDLSVAAATKTAIDGTKDPAGKFDAAVDGLFGADVDITQLGALGDAAARGATSKGFTKKKQDKAKELQKTLTGVFGFVPGSADFDPKGKPISDRAIEFMNSLIARAEVSPAKLIDQLGGAADQAWKKTKSAFEGAKDFLTGAKKFTLPGSAEVSHEVAMPITAYGAKQPAQVRPGTLAIDTSGDVTAVLPTGGLKPGVQASEVPVETNASSIFDTTRLDTAQDQERARTDRARYDELQAAAATALAQAQAAASRGDTGETARLSKEYTRLSAEAQKVKSSGNYKW